MRGRKGGVKGERKVNERRERHEKGIAKRWKNKDKGEEGIRGGGKEKKRINNQHYSK